MRCLGLIALTSEEKCQGKQVTLCSDTDAIDILTLDKQQYVTLCYGMNSINILIRDKILQNEQHLFVKMRHCAMK